MSDLEKWQILAEEALSDAGEWKRAARHYQTVNRSLLNALELAEATIMRLERHAPGSQNGTLDVVREAIAQASKLP